MARAARSGCPSPCTPRARRSRAGWRAAPWPRAGPACATTWPRGPVVAELEAIARALAFAAETPAARCTSSTSRPAAASRWSPRRGRAGSTSTLRDLPALPRARRGGRRARSARSPSARRRCAAPPSARRCGRRSRRRRRHGRLRPLAVAAGAQGRRRLLRGLGRDRRRPDAAGAARREGVAARPGAARAGEVEIKLAGKTVRFQGKTPQPQWLTSQPLDLDFDYHPLEVSFLKTSAIAKLALFSSGPDFRLEPIPARTNARSSKKPFVHLQARPATRRRPPLRRLPRRFHCVRPARPPPSIVFQAT